MCILCGHVGLTDSPVQVLCKSCLSERLRDNVKDNRRGDVMDAFSEIDRLFEEADKTNNWVAKLEATCNEAVKLISAQSARIHELEKKVRGMELVRANDEKP
jgi:hypothetical protein